MSARVRIINGKGDATATPPTGADDHDLQGFENDFVESGGVLDLAGDDCLVEELDTPGMGVKVAKGVVYVENDAWTENSLEPKFFVVTRDEEENPVSISSNPSGSTRYDLICQKIDTSTTPNDEADNICPIVIVEGTPGAGAPSVPANHELLATIEVGDGATSIENADITDGRRQVSLDDSLVGAASETHLFGSTSEASNATPTPTGNKKRNEYYLTALATDATFAAPSGTPANGNVLLVRIKDNGTPRSLSFNSIYREMGITLPTSTTANKTIYLGFIYHSGSSKWDCVAVAEQD